MQTLKKYSPFLILIAFMIIFLNRPAKLSLAWVGLVILFIGIILLFEFIENSRPKRTRKWSGDRPGKLSYIVKFALLIGLPISLIISALIYSRADPLNLLIFLVIPLTAIFGWIGYMDWQSCDKIFLESKYNVNLKQPG